MKPLSLTSRISLLFAVSAGLVLCATSLFLARAVDAHFAEGDRHEVGGKLELIRNLLGHAAEQAAFDRLPQQLDDALVGHDGLVVEVADASGGTWYATPGISFPPGLRKTCADRALPCANGLPLRWDHAGVGYRGEILSIAVGDSSPFMVTVGLDVGRHESFMRKFMTVLAVAAALATLATAGLGWLITRWGLAPLRQVTDLVGGMSAERLTERLPTDPLPSELEPLAIAFNSMLVRLDDSFRRLSEFSANIAHELRTPISNLMTQTQVALSGARNAEEYKEILYSSLEEYERMAQMVGDMLYIAQTENGPLQPGPTPVDLAEEARGLFEYFEAWAAERGVSLALSGEASAIGDRLMLRRAMSNLIANAIRHCPRGKTVNVVLERASDHSSVTVENPGPEIPAEHLPHLFERFYRVDPSRRREGDGAGLGLAIVKSIVQAHGGGIGASSTRGLTRFTFTLPVARS